MTKAYADDLEMCRCSCRMRWLQLAPVVGNGQLPVKPGPTSLWVDPGLMLQDWAAKVVRSGPNRLAPDLVSYGRGLRLAMVAEGRRVVQ